MEKMTAVFFLAVFGFGLISTIEGCTCPVDHSQTRFCNADYAIVAYIEDAVVTEDRNMKYTVIISHIFKGGWLIGDDVQQYVYTPFRGNLCGRPNLKRKTAYLISGSIVQNQLIMIYCNWVEEWKLVSDDQKAFLMDGIYESQCGSNCRIWGVYNTVKVNHNHNPKYAHSIQTSGLWTHNNCEFNPVPSAIYGGTDCETKYSYCMQTEEGSCKWQRATNYNTCFVDREKFWEIKNSPAAAFTSFSQCKAVANRKLKRKCRRFLRKMRKIQARHEASVLNAPDNTLTNIDALAALGLDLDIFNEQS